MAAKKEDQLLAKGLVGIMDVDPFDSESVVASYIKTDTLPRNGTGIKTLAKRIADSKGLHKAHGKATTQDIVLAAFADVVKAKSTKWVIDTMSGASDELAKLAAIAKVNEWNLAIADMDEDVKMAKDMQSEMADYQAKVDEISDQLSKLRDKVASKLDIDPTFDLALSAERGFFVSSDTKAKGTKTRTPITRDFAKDEYSKTGKYKGLDAIERTAKVLHRDGDNVPDQWQVRMYGPDGKVYKTVKGDIGQSLYEVAKPINDAWIDEFAPKYSKALNVYHHFDIS